MRECLDSIAASELDCWEAILIDDGSPDRCPHICDEYAAKDKRFRVIHQENAGVAAARNVGIDIAKGEWIWFVDSDDVVDMRPVEGIMNETLRYDTELTPTKHEASFATKTGNDVLVDLVMFDLETIDGNGNVNQNENQGVNKKVSVKVMVNVSVDKNQFLLENVFFHHQRLWYRRNLLNQYELRFTKGVRLAEDLELMYKYMTLCQHPVKIDNTLYYYREREGSATQNDSYRAKAVEDLQIVLNNLAEWIRKYNILPEPWLDLRIMKLFQNFLYSASLINDRGIINIKNQVNIQKSAREIIADYKSLGFSFVSKMKYRLAIWNIKIYNILNCLYLKICCVK